MKKMLLLCKGYCTFNCNRSCDEAMYPLFILAVENMRLRSKRARFSYYRNRQTAKSGLACNKTATYVPSGIPL